MFLSYDQSLLLYLSIHCIEMVPVNTTEQMFTSESECINKVIIFIYITRSVWRTWYDHPDSPALLPCHVLHHTRVVARVGGLRPIDPEQSFVVGHPISGRWYPLAPRIKPPAQQWYKIRQDILVGNKPEWGRKRVMLRHRNYGAIQVLRNAFYLEIWQPTS